MRKIAVRRTVSCWSIRSLAILVAAMVTACGDSPTAPPPGGPKEPVPTVSRLEVAGPREIAPASTVQFRATAHFEDGTTRDVTDEASWTTSHAGVFTVSRGLVTASANRGHANLRAALNGRVLDSEVIVVPPGTFRVMGVVTEPEGSGYGVPDALVEAATPEGVLSTKSLFNGEYRLYGVAGATEIRVTKSGYQPFVRTINVSGHDRVDLELGPEQPRPQLSGTYTLTISADATCFSELPSEVMTRSYTAVITQQGPRLTVELQGGKFVNEVSGMRNRFSGSVESGQPVFQLLDFFDDQSCSVGPSHECYIVGDVVEELGPTSYFNPTGKVAAIESGSTISGTLEGTLYLRGLQAGRYPAITSCTSKSHRFTLNK